MKKDDRLPAGLVGQVPGRVDHSVHVGVDEPVGPTGHQVSRLDEKASAGIETTVGITPVFATVRRSVCPLARLQRRHPPCGPGPWEAEW